MEMSSWALLAGWLVTIGIAFSSLGKRKLPKNIIIIADHEYDDAQIMEVINVARELMHETRKLPELTQPLLTANGGVIRVTTTPTTAHVV